MTKTLKRKPKEHLVQIAIDQKYYDYLQRKTQSLGITRSEYIRSAGKMKCFLSTSKHICESNPLWGRVRMLLKSKYGHP